MMGVQVQRDPGRNRLRLTFAGGLRTQSNRADASPAARFRVTVYENQENAERDAEDAGAALFLAEVTLGHWLLASGGFSSEDFIVGNHPGGGRMARTIGSVVRVVNVPDAAAAVVRVEADTRGILLGSESDWGPGDDPGLHEASVITTLWGPAPNPAADRVFLRFSIAGRQHARVEIFDLLGRRVVTLMDGIAKPGPQQISWRRRDARGSHVRNGVYFVRLRSGDKEFVRRFVLMR